LKEGDYITKINGVKVVSGSEMVEQVAGYKPGDKITITYQRDGKEFNSTITLKNRSGSYSIVKSETLESLGGEFETLSAEKAKEYGFRGGVIVKRIKENGLIDQQTRMRDGFIIIKANGVTVNNVEELENALSKGTRIVFDGFYPGYDGSYSYVLETK
jgi:serine protease Do